MAVRSAQALVRARSAAVSTFLLAMTWQTLTSALQLVLVSSSRTSSRIARAWPSTLSPSTLVRDSMRFLIAVRVVEELAAPLTAGNLVLTCVVALAASRIVKLHIMSFSHRCTRCSGVYETLTYPSSMSVVVRLGVILIVSAVGPIE